MNYSSHRSKQYSIFALLLMALLTVLIFALSIHAADDSKGITTITQGQTLCTQYSLFYEKNRYLTTNYLKGILLPVNTEVKFIKADHKTIVIFLPDGQNLTIENVANYSGESIDGILARTLAAKPVDLSQFTEDEKKAIMAGEVEIGMRKSAVIVAIGYPPKHKTQSLIMNQWRYWQNRFGTLLVIFDNDKVIRVRN